MKHANKANRHTPARRIIMLQLSTVPLPLWLIRRRDGLMEVEAFKTADSLSAVSLIHCWVN